MELLIFRTDIKSKKKIKCLKPIFNQYTDILNWSVDLEDIDNVLRIEAKTHVTEDDIIKMVQKHGFFIKTLPD